MINILYEDKFLVVCEKPVNILSEEQTNTKRTMPDILKKMTGAYKIDTIHRLDKMVGGTICYSKSRKATALLSKMVVNHSLTKEYLAIIHGKPDKESAEFHDYLFKDSKKNKSFAVKTLRKGAKEASLEYNLIATKKAEKGEMSLVKIKLHTGRTHQIRVQFSSRGYPLVGDGKYGSHDNGCFISLWAYHLAFVHPILNKQISEFSLPNLKEYPWNLFKEEINKQTEGVKND